MKVLRRLPETFSGSLFMFEQPHHIGLLTTYKQLFRVTVDAAVLRYNETYE